MGLIVVLLPFVTFLLQSVAALKLDECRVSALGLGSGDIIDSQIIASSSFDKQSVGPQNARLNAELASGAWCPKPQITAKSYEFLQVNLNQTFVITGIETQGRYGNGTGREFAAEYFIHYLRPDSQWMRYRNRSGHTVMTGNFDTTTAVMRSLDPPIIASRIRIVPQSKQTRTVCLRAEVHGCPHTDGLLYYSTVPDGSRLDKLDFKDPIFEESELRTEVGIRRGLGLLTDGYVATMSPFDEKQPNASWIGWNKHHHDGVVNMLFEFDKVHNFSDVILSAFGNRIDQIDINFSQDGTSFPLSSNIQSSERISNNSTARMYEIRLPLHKRAAKKVRITIRFSTEWFFLTEVNFVSVTADNTTSEVVGVSDAEVTSQQKMLVLIGIALLMTIVLFALCILFCLRIRRKNEKKEFKKEGMKRDLVITHMGNKPSCHVFPSPHLLLLDHNEKLPNYYNSQKTTSTSVSSKSSLSQKHSPPTWSDFNFPPPPEVSEERIYADPCVTLPLLPSHQKNLTCSPSRSKTLSGKHRQQAKTASNDALEKMSKFSSSALLLGVDIGEGKFTVVRECVLPGGHRAAHKSVKDTTLVHGRKALQDEILALAVCGKHPRIVELYAIDEQSNAILEYMELGDIKTFLRTTNEPIDMSTMVSIWLDVCSAMSHLEKSGLVHGHLTPHNILLDEHLRAKVSSPRGPSHHAQLRYSSPESILGNEITSKSDVWAYAVCVWEMAYGCRQMPYERLSNAQLIDNAGALLENKNEGLVLQFPTSLPHQVSKILADCFLVPAANRPQFEHISRCISSSRVS